MITVTDSNLFDLAVQQLVAHAAQVPHFRGRFIQIFFALKCFQNEIPSMWSGTFIGTDVLQTLFDDLYSKASREATESVWSLATGEFLARTGMIGPGNTTPQNTWRNNLNLQKGIGCYAPPQELGSQAFLDEPRVQCRYLEPARPGVLAGARCQLCTGPVRPQYRGENHRKWLRISPDGEGYATVDLRKIDNFAPYVAPGGNRIPLIPLLVALYHDTLAGLPISGRSQVSLLDFTTDFNFTHAELDAYFDASNANQFNAVILAAQPGSSIAAPVRGVPVAFVPGPRPAAPAPRPVSPEPLVAPTEVAPPVGNTGWDAESFVRQALEDARWRVTNVTRQKLGYDLFAERGAQRRFIEVKSSINLCRPVFTAREWQQAKAQRRSYILAVVENFNPERANVIYWIPDPTSCSAREALTTEYAVGRSAWVPAAIEIDQI